MKTQKTMFPKVDEKEKLEKEKLEKEKMIENKRLTVEEKWRLVFKQTDGPPMYKAEEYTFQIRKYFTEKGITATAPTDCEGNLEVKPEEKPKELKNAETLKDLQNISDLLKCLKFDLKLAHISFMSQFLRTPHHGAFLLLDYLKYLQQQQTAKNNNCSVRRKLQDSRQALADEYECLLALKYATRHQEGIRRITDHPSGLFLLASSAVSNFAKSRITALQLLTLSCESPTGGHTQVMKALSTVRLRQGEPVRFTLLIGMLNSPTNKNLSFQVHCLNFFSKLLDTSKNVCERVYLQCEMEEAGLDVKFLDKLLEQKDSVDHKQYVETVANWKRLYVDLESLMQVSKRLSFDNKQLKNELDNLKKSSKQIEEEKTVCVRTERMLVEECTELKQKLNKLQSQLTEKISKSYKDKGTSMETTSVKYETVDNNKFEEKGDREKSKKDSKSSKSSYDAMSISSGDSPDAREEDRDNNETDLIVPKILNRRTKYVWEGNDVSLKKDVTTQASPNTNNTAATIIATTPATHFRKNQNTRVVGRKIELRDEEGVANWSYPDVPQPIAIVTTGLSSLQDMNVDEPRGDDSALRMNGYKRTQREFHKELFQKAYPVPSFQRNNIRPFHI